MTKKVAKPRRIERAARRVKQYPGGSAARHRLQVVKALVITKVAEVFPKLKEIMSCSAPRMDVLREFSTY